MVNSSGIIRDQATDLETFTHINVFCDDRDFMTIASSVVSRLALFPLVSSEVFETCPDEVEEDTGSNISSERVLCREGTCSDSAAAFLRSEKEREVADFFRVGIASRMVSDLDTLSSDMRRGLRGVVGASGVAGQKGDGGSWNSSLTGVLTGFDRCLRLVGHTYSMILRPTRVSICKRMG